MLALFIILVTLMMTLFSEKVLISNRCIDQKIFDGPLSRMIRIITLGRPSGSIIWPRLFGIGWWNGSGEQDICLKLGIVNNIIIPEPL